MSQVQMKMTVFFIGAIGYSIVEVAFRGYTHWTMVLTGGFVFSLLYTLEIRMDGSSLWQKCLAGTVVITSVEFAVGCVVNLWLDWGVWDYSMYRFQVLGQVCLLFSFLWFLLCAPIFFIADRMKSAWRDVA